MRIEYETELYHHGIRGQKWGVRRFQNTDGSLTTKGKTRYSNTANNSSATSSAGAGGGGGGGDEELTPEQLEYIAGLEEELAELTPGSVEYAKKKQEIEDVKSGKFAIFKVYDYRDDLSVKDRLSDHIKDMKERRQRELDAKKVSYSHKIENTGSSTLHTVPSPMKPVVNTEKKRPVARKKKKTSAGTGVHKREEVASTSNRPTARKKNVVSGGTGVRKRKKVTNTTNRPFSRKKNVTSNGKGVKRRGSSGASKSSTFRFKIG